jgi:divalent metal cation (Fe/Co/Zn/Cd) transporter
MADFAHRTTALRVGVRLEAITVAWMAVEAAVAIGAGVAARSVLLTAFGADSAIELISGLTLLWRLRAEARGASTDQVESVEDRATAVSAVLLVLLCVYVLATSLAGLFARIRPQGSLLGLVVASAAVLAMPVLAWRKRIVNQTLHSSALRADIAESTTCAYLAAITLVGVALTTLFGWWWADYAGALVLLVWLGREAKETLDAARGAQGHHD